MTDIVERLRAEVDVYYGKRPAGLLNEAAAEIERLRAVLAEIAAGCANPMFVARRALDKLV